jgi:hypothetical protein
MKCAGHLQHNPLGAIPLDEEMVMSEPATTEEEHASFARFAAIAATLHRYLDAARAGDGGLMRTAFIPEAHVSGSYAGQPVDWTVAQFCAAIDAGGPAAGLEANIVHIDQCGGAATARLEAENWRGTRYTDFFVLRDTGADWRIAAKVFHAHSRA